MAQALQNGRKLDLLLESNSIEFDESIPPPPTLQRAQSAPLQRSDSLAVQLQSMLVDSQNQNGMDCDNAIQIDEKIEEADEDDDDDDSSNGKDDEEEEEEDDSECDATQLA